MIINSGAGRYEALDALRGIAALMVVLFHFSMGREEAKLGFNLGNTGVDLFFIISGFVIFMTLKKVTKSVEFIINRFCKLYPTYWTSVTFTFIAIIIFFGCEGNHTGRPDLMQYLGNMTMFQFYLGITNLDGPYWTMIVEMLFYMGMLFLFHFKLLRYLNVIGSSLSILVVLIIYLFGNSTLVKETIFWIPLLQYIPLFLAGTVFYKIYTDEGSAIKNYSLIMICFICQLLIRYLIGSSLFVMYSEYTTMLVIYFLLFTLFVNNKLNFIVSKETVFLGKISFALYLIHQFISVNILIPFLIDTLHLNFWVASFGITLPIILFIAYLITYLTLPLSKGIKEKLRTTVHLQAAIVN